MPASALLPQTAADAAQMLAAAAAERRRIVPVGANTKRTWAPVDPSVDVLDTRALLDGFLHDPGDMVATLPAGMTLAEANRRLSTQRQWLPLDPPFADRATIGGIIASNDSGPRRHAYGAVRDLIVGIELALTDGRVVKAGGRVVKNVAGYDLSRLFCGSHGSLGIVTHATFKLVPLAPGSMTVVSRFSTAAEALAFANAVAHAPVTPTAVELNGPDWTVFTRFETTAAAAQLMADAVKALSPSASHSIVRDDDEHTLWQHHIASLWDEGVILKVSVLPGRAAAVVAAAEAVIDGGCEWTIGGRAALGVLFVRLTGNASVVSRAADAIARAVVAERGHVRVLSSAHIGVLSSRPDTGAVAVMQAVKQRFDPHAVLPVVPGIA